MIINGFTKGGFQTMGTKRLGLARVEALLENLKREITMGAGTTMVGARKVVKGSTNSAPLTLTAEDSGAIVAMTGTAHTVILPAPTAGVEFKIVAASAANHQVWTAGTNVFQGQNLHSTGGTTVAIVDLRAKGKLVLSAGAIGDIIDCWSDGTNWYVRALTDAAVTPGTF
jgi:hypothetical protein